MRTLFITLTFFLVSALCPAQGVKLCDLKETLPIYNAPESPNEQVSFTMAYGSSIIANKDSLSALKKGRVLCIDIVYSDYPKGKQFNSLMQRRINSIKALDFSLFNNPDVKWRLVRQTACIDKASASALFHGVMVTYRKPQSPKETAIEIAFLKDLFKNGHEPAKPVTKKDGDYYGDSINIDAAHGSIVPIVSIISKPIAPPPRYRYYDSSVQSVLSRNTWEDMVIVADVTASMYGYTAGLFTWLRLNTNSGNAKQFVFFNDGDMTPDERKVIGSTKGIYSTYSGRYENVESVALNTMGKGSGGDAAENNIEAVIKAIDLCKDCNVVMIADNWAAVKDISLLDKVTKPIKVIVCGGTEYGIHVDYLNVALATGGSVHTLQEDLNNLMDLKEGESIIIRRNIYKIQGRKFVQVHSM